MRDALKSNTGVKLWLTCSSAAHALRAEALHGDDQHRCKALRSSAAQALRAEVLGSTGVAR